MVLPASQIKMDMNNTKNPYIAGLSMSALGNICSAEVGRLSLPLSPEKQEQGDIKPKAATNCPTAAPMSLPLSPQSQLPQQPNGRQLKNGALIPVTVPVKHNKKRVQAMLKQYQNSTSSMPGDSSRAQDQVWCWLQQLPVCLSGVSQGTSKCDHVNQ